MLQRPNALQVQIVIDEIEPRIWRRLVIPLHWTLEDLHLVIQSSFGWWNYHAHEFRIGGLRFGEPAAASDYAFEGSARVFDYRQVQMRDFDPGSVFQYTYDFGDDWRHLVEIETFLLFGEAPKHASCIDGARATPPEDVGGPQGYEQFLAILGDHAHPEHGETVRWCGGHFDPEWFDLAVINEDLKNALRRNVRRRLRQPTPKLASR